MPEVQQTIAEIPPWFVGALVAAIVALSGVVGYLFKLYNRRVVSSDKRFKEQEERHAQERHAQEARHTQERTAWLEEKAAWDAEREAEHARLALNYETKAKELAESYIARAQSERTEHLAREEQIRQDNAKLLEKLADKAEESRAMMVGLLQKMHDRFVGSRRRPGG